MASDMSVRHEMSLLGAFLLGCDCPHMGSPDHSAPAHDVHPWAVARSLPKAPDTWLSQLMHQYMFQWDRVAWFGSCKAGRDWVASTAKTARVNLHLWDAQGSSRALNAVAAVLRVRGDLPTTLRVEQRCPEGLMQFPDLLHGSGQHIAKLAHITGFRHEPSVQQAFLSATATALPNLTTLSIDHLNSVLPPAGQLPQLTDLYVKIWIAGDQEAACRSVAAYLPQLRELHVCGASDADAPHLLGSSAPSNTLEKLHLHMSLTDPVLGLVQHAAPALQQLAVVALALQTAQHARLQWLVERLTLETREVDTQQLERLPEQAPGNNLVIQHSSLCPITLWMTAVTPQGLSATLQERLPRWVFSSYRTGTDLTNTALWPDSLHHLTKPALATITLQASDDLPQHAQPEALRASLQQRRHVSCQLSAFPVLSCPSPTLWLSNWDWTDTLFQTLQSGATQLTQHDACSSVGLDVYELIDEVVDLQLQHAPCVTRWRVEELELQQDHGQQTCGWTELRLCGEVGPQLTDLALVPTCQKLNVKSESYSPHFTLTLTPEQVEAGLVTQLTARFSHMLFHHQTICSPLVAVECPPELPVDQQPAHLRACLEVLCVMEDARNLGGPCVLLQGWCLTPEVVSELSGLPDWAEVLDLSQSTWLPDLNTYTALAKQVPGSCTTWFLQGATQPHVLDILIGLSVHGMDKFREWSHYGMPALVLVLGRVEWLPKMEEYVKLMFEGGSEDVGLRDEQNDW